MSFFKFRPYVFLQVRTYAVLQVRPYVFFTSSSVCLIYKFDLMSFLKHFFDLMSFFASSTLCLFLQFQPFAFLKVRPSAFLQV